MLKPRSDVVAHNHRHPIYRYRRSVNQVLSVLGNGVQIQLVTQNPGNIHQVFNQLHLQLGIALDGLQGKFSFDWKENMRKY